MPEPTALAEQPGRPAEVQAEAQGRSLQLLQLLSEGGGDLNDVAGELEASIVELARWALQPENSALLDGLMRLEDARSALAVCRYRVAAAATLMQIAAGHRDPDGQPGDLARKACADLLAADAMRQARDRRAGASPGAAPPRSDAAPAVPDEQAILRELERLGDAF